MKGFVIGVIIFSVALLFGVPFLMSSSQVTPEETKILTNVTTSDWTYGNKEAKVVLIEYLDFQCEACARVYPMTEKVKEEYKDRVLFVTRYFPLSGHQYSRQSASVVEASGQQGKYWKMFKLMFERQTTWSESDDPTTLFNSYAKELNLDMEKFNVDIKSQTTKDRIDNDFSSGNKLNVQGTPSFFINGRKMSTPTDITAFRKVLDEELAK